MKLKPWMLVLAASILGALIWAAPIHAAAAPIKVVEKLSFQREAPAVAKVGGKLTSVRCAATRTAYIYVCNFAGTASKTGKRVCAATYVHYNPNNPQYGKPYKVNFWGLSWPCGTRPVGAPPAFPGDGGPSS